MRTSGRFGVELPCFTADPFLTKEDRFYSLRLMPEGTVIPKQGHGNELLASRIKEIGFDYVAYDLKPHDLDGAVGAARWASANGLSIALNNPACIINAAPTEGLTTWAYPPELVEKVKSEADVVGLIYDELNHHQLHCGIEGHTNAWHALADVSGETDAESAYNKVEAGLGRLFAHTEATGVPAMTEEVVPVLLHATARSGGVPGCKVLKEQITPLSLTMTMSAAHQYKTNWFGTVDLWEGDSGPWYQICSRNSGHSAREFQSALKLMALLNPSAALVESGDLLWVIDSGKAELTEFGEAAKQFFHDVLPGLKPGFDVHSWQPTVAVVRCEDGNFIKAAPPGQNGIYDIMSRRLLGGGGIANTEASSKWLKAWYHLTWGKCSGKTLHNYFNPGEQAIARQYDVGGTEHEITGPPIDKRRDPSRAETHMHSLFAPLANAAVFDGYVKASQLATAELIVLTGSYCRRETQVEVMKAVMAGARCICQAECAPDELQDASGLKLGEGYWWTVPHFDDDDAMEQLLQYRGHHNQWTLRSDLGLLRIYSTDAWGNAIDWELEQL